MDGRNAADHFAAQLRFPETDASEPESLRLKTVRFSNCMQCRTLQCLLHGRSFDWTTGLNAKTWEAALKHGERHFEAETTDLANASTSAVEPICPPFQ